jgi:hypothetical protein
MGNVAKEFVQDIKTSLFDRLTGRVYLRDWTHAAKVFLPGKQGNAGKVKFTFHTYFGINEQAWGKGLGYQAGENYGILVKQVKLPTFNIDVETMNQYNRKRLIQSKIKYQPIDITFHDDNMSQVTAMWDAYYRYNYADSWNPVVDPFGGTALKNFNRRNIYDPSLSGDQEYGYRGDARGSTFDPKTGGEKVPFFNNITVYGLWAGNFIAYTLINPIITSFDHDTYSYDEGQSTMQNRMTVDYETVIYNTGTIDEKEKILGFQYPSNYDPTESPLEQGGSNPADIYDRMKSLGGDDSLWEKAQTVGQLYDGGLDTVVDSAKKALKETAKDALMNKLFGGGETDTSALFPTEGTSSTMVGLANQGIVTAANNANTTQAGNSAPAGNQVSTSGAGGT